MRGCRYSAYWESGGEKKVVSWRIEEWKELSGGRRGQ